MIQKVLVLLLLTIVLKTSFLAEAQQPITAPRIRFLSRELHPSDSRAARTPRVEAFRQGLRELGYIEGKNIIIEYRYAEGRLERLPVLAEELVRLNVEIIVSDTFTTARAAKQVATTIPIVVASGDPFGTGLVASLAQPGGNVTGLSNYIVELLGKRLELLKEVVPKISAFAFLNETEVQAAKLCLRTRRSPRKP